MKLARALAIVAGFGLCSTALADDPPNPAYEYDPYSQAWNGMASFVGLAEGMGFSVTA